MPAVLEIVEHPQAPLFTQATAPLLLKQLASEGISGSEDARELLREASLVNLWFFGKYVAGYSGPFDLLNDDLHVEMCNFRQRLLEPGCRGGMFIPRGHYKSTIVTELGTAWELLRSPWLRIRITNAIADKAQDFLKSVKAMFESNDMMKWLFPEFCYTKGQEGWNDTVLTLPMQVRGKKYREASVEYGGVGGASEGHHYDLHIVDDMVGLAALNSARGSNAVMVGTENWFWASEKPLLVSMRHSRVIVVGTRYAVDDVYDSIVKKAKSCSGYPLRSWDGIAKGPWQIYYRKGIEDGEIIFPEQFTKEAYDEMAKNDWWTYVTQYLNDPTEAGLAELTGYKCREADMFREGDDWFISIPRDGENDETYDLADCDVIMAIDPAGTEKYINAKTSRSVVMMQATTPRDHKVYFDVKAGYVPATTMFDWMFDNAKRFAPYLRASFLESNAGFKVLSPILREEERRRGINLHLRPFPSVGDKDARIRNTLQPELNQELLYTLSPFLALIGEELMSFPQSKKKDIVDCMSIAVANRYRPPSSEERENKRKAQRKWMSRSSNVCGY